MRKAEKIVLSGLTILITTLIVYVMVRVGTSDLAFSIVPGWHTTIYPVEITWAMLTALILITTLLVYIIFRIIFKILKAVTKRILP